MAADISKTVKDAVDKGKDLLGIGKDSVEKGKDSADKATSAADKAKNAPDQAKGAVDKAKDKVEKASKAIEKYTKSLTGKKEDKKEDKKKEKEPDPIDYRKMIPSFRFYVSFVKDGDKEKYAKKAFKKAEDLPPGIAFSEVSGLSLELQTEDFMEGGGNGYTIRLPKPPKAKNLVLKRALTAVAPEEISWARKAVESFNFETRTVIVSIINYGGDPVKTWNCESAYPVKLSLSDLGASKNEIVIETLELAYMKFSLMDNDTQNT